MQGQNGGLLYYSIHRCENSMLTELSKENNQFSNQQNVTIGPNPSSQRQQHPLSCVSQAICMSVVDKDHTYERVSTVLHSAEEISLPRL